MAPRDSAGDGKNQFHQNPQHCKGELSQMLHIFPSLEMQSTSSRLTTPRTLDDDASKKARSAKLGRIAWERFISSPHLYWHFQSHTFPRQIQVNRLTWLFN